LALMPRRTLIAIAIVIIIATALATYYAIQTTQTGGATAQKAKDVIKIGFTVALSGGGAASGIEQLRGYEICKDWINSQGGLYIREYGKKIPIQLIYYDDSSDPAKARSLYEKLITEDKVDLLWAPWGTSIGLAVVPVLDKYNIPVILNTHTVSESTIKQLGTKNIFVTFSDHESVGMAFALFVKKLLADHKDLRRIAIIYAETDMSVGHFRWTKKVLEDQGIGELVFYGSYPVAATDVRGLLLKVKEANPDILIAHTFAGDTFLVFAQLRELNINPKVLLMGTAATTSAFYTRFDNKTKEGTIAWTTWHPSLHPVLKEFFDTYSKKYGYTPSNGQLGVVFLSCFIFKEAVEKAGSLDPNKIREVLNSESFDTPFGRVRFRDQIIDPPLILFIQYQDGLAQPVFIASGRYPDTKPAQIAALADIIYPKPQWS